MSATGCETCQRPQSAPRGPLAEEWRRWIEPGGNPEGGVVPRTGYDPMRLVIHRANGSSQEVKVLLRIDTPIEVDYYKHGGILPFVLRQLLAA